MDLLDLDVDLLHVDNVGCVDHVDLLHLDHVDLLHLDVALDVDLLDLDVDLLHVDNVGCVDHEDLLHLDVALRERCSPLAPGSSQPGCASGRQR